MAVEPGRQQTETSPEPSQDRMDRVGHRGYSRRRFREVLDATRHLDWGDTHPANRAAAIQMLARSTMPLDKLHEQVSRIFIPDQRDAESGTHGLFTNADKSVTLSKPIRALDDRGKVVPHVHAELTLLHELQHGVDFAENGQPSTIGDIGINEARADIAAKKHHVPHRKDVKRLGLEKIGGQAKTVYSATADAFNDLGQDASALLSHEQHGPSARRVIDAQYNPLPYGAKPRSDDWYRSRAQEFFGSYDRVRRTEG